MTPAVCAAWVGAILLCSIGLFLASASVLPPTTPRLQASYHGLGLLYCLAALALVATA